MKRRRQEHTTLYKFLESTGVLINGNDAEIQTMKKKYWADYKREHRRNKRKEQKLISFWCTKSEYSIVSKEAWKHGLSRPKFSKQSVFAYLNNRYLVPDINDLHNIQQLLLLNHTTLQQLFEERVLLVSAEKDVMRAMRSLEEKVLAILQHPRTLEEFIKTEMMNNPGTKNSIQSIIDKY